MLYLYYKYESERAASWSIRQIKANEGFAEKCIKCGQCEQVCPQHLNIRKDLATLSEEMKELFK